MPNIIILCTSCSILRCMVFLKSRPCTCWTWMWLWYRSICQIGFPACRRISDFTTWVCQLNQNDGQLCPFKWRGMYGKWSFILPLGTSRCIHTTCTYTRIISRSYSTLINTSSLCVCTMVSHIPSLLGERISGHIGLTTLCYGVYNLYCFLHGAVEWVLFDIFCRVHCWTTYIVTVYGFNIWCGWVFQHSVKNKAFIIKRTELGGHA